MLREYGTTRDLLWILTRVNHKVATEFESKPKDKKKKSEEGSQTSQPNGKNPESKCGDKNAVAFKQKQVPSIISMLTKDIVFVPKPKKVDPKS